MKAKIIIGQSSAPEIVNIDDFVEGVIYQSSYNSSVYVMRDSVDGYIRIDDDGDVMGYEDSCQLLDGVNDVDSFIVRPDLVAEITLKSAHSKG
ncbi:hypothetical protein My1_002 [Pectobacterium phage My1]|uniref:Uncharacterized protein n=1 Tax=Pectobacterium phage My1 TaxID=1204539 RepID=J9QPP4_9CAUD|nr:hypothetical protein My1_002 [Pectobacterium phage My1]AFQ22161.1 hypothetical protein My1_002 [Pectobacterium phage My1]